mmetsp:Transcript_30509/g.44866  ORF Transcript_30509/g.44866 Transcript_30509/m.44866 type:complete len:81 (-) Transcript_30509:296-538(-)
MRTDCITVLGVILRPPSFTNFLNMRMLDFLKSIISFEKSAAVQSVGQSSDAYRKGFFRGYWRPLNGIHFLSVSFFDFVIF